MRNAASRLALAAIVSALIWLGQDSTPQAQSYPNRPIHFVVPVLAGGPNDFVARLLADRMGKSMGQPVVVEYKVGAGGMLGTEYVAKQSPDGYTILATALTHVVSPNFVQTMGYEPIKDFAPIAKTVSTKFVLVVNPSVPAENMREFIALARTKPETLTYASAGVGTPHQLATELLESMTGTQMIHVPYKGANEIIPAVLSHQVDFTIIATFGVLPFIKNGKLRALAVASPTRSAQLPNVPTIAEALPLPGYSIDVWQGVLAPAGTPTDVVHQLNQEITTALADPENVKKLEAFGLDPTPSTPEQFEATMKSDMEKWANVIKHARVENK